MFEPVRPWSGGAYAHKRPWPLKTLDERPRNHLSNLSSFGTSMKNEPDRRDDANDPMNSEHFYRLSRLPHFFRRTPVPIFGAACFATAEDLRAYLNHPDEANPSRLLDATILAEAPGGKTYDPLYKRTFFIPDDTRTRNTLGVGQTGAGKTSELIDPLIYSDIRSGDCSIVVIDAKGDSHHKHSPFLRAYRPNQTVRVINFAEAARSTHGWNFLAGYADEAEDLNRAETMCYAVDGESPRHWDNQYWSGGAARFIAATISCLRREHGTVCPASVHWMLERGHTANVELWTRHPDVAFANEALAFLKSGSHNAETVLSTAQMYLRSMRNRSMAAVTSADEFRIEEIFRKPGVVFIEIPQGEIDKIRPFVNIFMSELFREAAAYASRMPGNRLPVPLRIHADDMVAAAGKVQGLASHLNLSRSRNIGFTAAVQSMAQIQETYGDQYASILAGFASKMFRAPVDPFDAEWVSRQCGTTTVEMVERMDRKDEDGRITRTRISRCVARPLLLPEDVRYAPEHFAYGRAWTVLLHDVRPFQMWLRASYHLPTMSRAIAQASRSARKPALREQPLQWTPGKPQGGILRKKTNPAAKNDSTFGLSPQVIAHIRELNELLEYDAASDDAQLWWDIFLDANPRDSVIRLMETLVSHSATIEEFYSCAMQCGGDDVTETVEFMIYRRLKQKFEPETEYDMDYEGDEEELDDEEVEDEEVEDVGEVEEIDKKDENRINRLYRNLENHERKKWDEDDIPF